MNERDFDNIFKDNIGDELPFDFRPDDWQAAAQELDKVLPAAIAAPAIVPQPRILTWHKWAAAAAVVFVASQTWLLAKLFDLNSEVTTLKSANVAEVQSSTQPTTETKTFVKYDTIVRTVVVESSAQKEATVSASEKASNSNIAANNDIYKKVYKDVYNQVRKEIGAELEATKAALAVATKGSTQSEQSKTASPNTPKNTENKANIATNVTSEKTGNNTVKNNEQNTQKDAPKDVLTPNITKNEAIASQKNELPSDKNNTPNDFDKNNNNIALIAAINKELGAFDKIPYLDSKSVKSIHNAQMWMNEDEKEALYWAAHRRTIIKPLSIPSNWSIGINALGVWSEYPKDSVVLNKGINFRLAYDLKNNWRVTADIETWKESFESKIDSNRHQPSPFPNYAFEKANYDSRLVQVRLGADYQYFNKTIFTPYIGAGVTYKKCTEKTIEVQLRNPQKPGEPPIRFNDKDFDKEFQSSSPLYASLRAGVNIALLKRLNLTTSITGQWRMNGNSNQTWSAQIGLAYTL